MKAHAISFAKWVSDNFLQHPILNDEFTDAITLLSLISQRKFEDAKKVKSYTYDELYDKFLKEELK